MFNVGNQVRRVQPGDYTDGRIGTIVELDSVKGRARVLWTVGKSYDGSQYELATPLRTWVSFKRLVIHVG